MASNIDKVEEKATEMWIKQLRIVKTKSEFEQQLIPADVIQNKG